MESLAALIERWNAFAPTLPVWIAPDLMWIVLPLALIALLFLGVFTGARRLWRLVVAVVAEESPVSVPGPLLRRIPGLTLRALRVLQPRAPAMRLGVALPA